MSKNVNEMKLEKQADKEAKKAEKAAAKEAKKAEKAAAREAKNAQKEQKKSEKPEKSKKDKKMKKDSKQKQIPFAHRLGFKFSALILIAVLLTASISVSIVVTNTITEIKNNVQNEMISLVKAYEDRINSKLIDFNGVISYAGYQNVLSAMKIEGVESSYAYVADSEKIIKYHPKEELVGTTVSENVASALYKENQGKGETMLLEYDYDGVSKYAGAIKLSDDSMLVITTNKDEILSGVTTFSIIAIVSSLVIIVLFGIIGLIFSNRLVRPIHQLVAVIDETADFDFQDDQNIVKVANRKDEIGLIGKSVARTREQLKQMVKDIQDATGNIFTEIERVNVYSNSIREQCMDNSATTEQLAAGMEETAATTTSIVDNIHTMQNSAADILTLSENGTKMSAEINERAASLKDSTEVASQRTTQMYGTIKEQTATAMQAAESVDKINEMTESIMQISSQTSLLALNASIEAARAGEAGRGFSVVASEIGKLAHETSESVSNINQIVAVVNDTVAEMVKSMQETTKFLEAVVLEDYAQFKSVSVQYSQDADSFKESMTEVQNSIGQLDEMITTIADAVTGISSTVDQSSYGITNIAEKTSVVVEQTANNAQLVETCLQAVDSLEDIAAKFKI